MRKTSSLLLAAALIVGIAALAPVPTQAIDWCLACDQSPECFSCCKCEGYGTGYCGALCGAPDEAADLDAAFTLDLEEIVACAAAEAPAVDEAPEADEAPSHEETVASE